MNPGLVGQAFALVQKAFSFERPLSSHLMLHNADVCLRQGAGPEGWNAKSEVGGCDVSSLVRTSYQGNNLRFERLEVSEKEETSSVTGFCFTALSKTVVGWVKCAKARRDQQWSVKIML